MKAPEMVEEIARFVGEPQTDVRAIDRALGAAGMRSKGRGLNAPDMTLFDGLRVLLGILVAPSTTRADRYVANFEVFTAESVKTISGSPEALRDLIGISFAEMKDRKLRLLDALARIASHLAQTPTPDGNFAGGNVWLEVRQGRWADVQIDAPGLFVGEVRFGGLMDVESTFRRVKRANTVDGRVLAWFGHTFAAELVDA